MCLSVCVCMRVHVCVCMRVRVCVCIFTQTFHFGGIQINRTISGISWRVSQTE